MAFRAFLGNERRHGELEQLLVRSGRGDVDAFAELYDRLAPRVFGLITSLVQDAPASEAITCEAFVESWRRSSTYDPDRCSATAWVLAVAHRMAVRAGRLSAATTSRTDPPPTDAGALLGTDLSRAQVDAVRLAYYSGLDHRRIDAALECAEPATALLTDGMRLLAPSRSPR